MKLAGEKGIVMVCGAALCLALSGCVERALLLRSQPEGAEIVLNGRDAGITPVRVSFETYGIYEVAAAAPGHKRLVTTLDVRPPWYERIPFDFFAELIWPATLRDVHEHTLTLEPLGPADDPGVTQREQQIRSQLETGGSR